MATGYDVRKAPQTGSANDLNDKGFIGGNDSQEWTIAVSNPDGNDNATSVRIACQQQGKLPREGEPHPSDYSLKLTSISLTQETPSFYTAQGTYTATPRPNDQSTDPDAAPWDIPASVEFFSVTSQVEIESDADGNDITNPGTKEPVKGVMRDVVDLGIRITKNFLLFNPSGIRTYSGKVNSDVFLGYEAGTVKAGEITANPSVHDGQTYYTCVVNAIVRQAYATTADKAWYHRRMCQGFYEVKDSKIARAVDGEGQYVTEPVRLNKTTGARLATGDSPQFIETKTAEEVAFSGMGIF